MITAKPTMFTELIAARMVPPLTACCSTPMSLVVREMISPVPQRSKKRSERRCMCSKRSRARR